MNTRVSKRTVNRQRWRERIETWKASGQSQKAFCKDHHLGLSAFQRWCRMFKVEDAERDIPSAQPVHFLPVRVGASITSHLTVRIQDDLRIEIPEGFDAKLLRQVIEILRSA